ncbi:MAG TPA: tetratricopeptide repeat protein, partial [Acidimicrobiia bacterium]|nr:tetratricopeptide repeat protein [Acidimicrobiia bacterium]
GTDPADLHQGYAAALINLSSEYDNLGRYDESVALNEEALTISRRLGDLVGTAVALGNLAEAAGRVGDVESARARFEEAIAASALLQSTHRLVEQYLQAGFFELSVGGTTAGRRHFQLALQQAEAGGLNDQARICEMAIATCDRSLGDPGAAERFVHSAAGVVANHELRSAPWVRQLILVMRSRVDAEEGNHLAAARALGAAGADDAAVLWWPLAHLRDRTLGELRAALDAAVLDAALAEGAALDAEARLALVTAEV